MTQVQSVISAHCITASQHHCVAMEFVESPVLYVNGSYSSRWRILPAEIIRPSESMIAEYHVRTVNPEVEPKWMPMHMAMTVVPAGTICNVSSYATMVGDSFKKTSETLLACLDAARQNAVDNNRSHKEFVRIDPKQESIEAIKKKTMIDTMAAKAHIKVLRYSADMSEAFGVGLRFD